MTLTSGRVICVRRSKAPEDEIDDYIVSPSGKYLFINFKTNQGSDLEYIFENQDSINGEIKIALFIFFSRDIIIFAV